MKGNFERDSSTDKKIVCRECEKDQEIGIVLILRNS